MRRRALLVTALVAVALPLAGCLDGAFAPDAAAGEAPTSRPPRVVFEQGARDGETAGMTSGDGHGGSRCTGLGSWSQPGLYEALPDAQGRDGAIVYHRGAPFGLPIGHPDVDAWREAALTYFGWRAPPLGEGGRGAGFFLYTGEARGQITLAVMAAPAWDRGALEPAFHEFAQAVTMAGEPTRDAWFERLYSSKEPGLVSHSPGEGEKVEEYSYAFDLGEERDLLELGRAWDARGGVAAADADSRSTSGRTLRWDEAEGGSWEARFELGVRTLETSTADGQPLWVDVNGLGDASAWSGASAPAGDVRAAIADALDRVGLPRPSFEAWRTDGGVC